MIDYFGPRTCTDCNKEFEPWKQYPGWLIVKMMLKDQTAKRCSTCFLKAMDLMFLEMDLNERYKRKEG